jgi:hypothetical protein
MGDIDTLTVAEYLALSWLDGCAIASIAIRW